MNHTTHLARQLLAFCACIFFLSQPIQAAEVTLVAHHFLPEQAPAHQKFLIPWKNAVEKASNGRIEVKLYPSMKLGGKPPELIDQVRDGKVDLVWTLPGYTPGRFPAISVFELPFMITNARDTSQAVQEFYQVSEAAQEEFKDVHPLIFWTHDRGVLHTRDKLVTTLEDLAGLKIRSPSERVSQSLIAYGAEPVPMPIPKMGGELKKGNIDGGVIPWEVVPSFKIHEIANNSTEFMGERGIYTSVFVFAMNKDKYNSLPADLKKVIDDNSGMSWAKAMGEEWIKVEQPGRNMAIKRGNNVIQMSEEEVAKMRTASYSVHAAWSRELNEKGLRGQSLLVTAYRLLNKYSQQ